MKIRPRALLVAAVVGLVACAGLSSTLHEGATDARGCLVYAEHDCYAADRSFSGCCANEAICGGTPGTGCTAPGMCCAAADQSNLFPDDIAARRLRSDGGPAPGVTRARLP